MRRPASPDGSAGNVSGAPISATGKWPYRVETYLIGMPEVRPIITSVASATPNSDWPSATRRMTSSLYSMVTSSPASAKRPSCCAR